MPTVVVYTDPLYVASPYGNWLTERDTPYTSRMSDWFRYKAATNIVIDANIVLAWQAADQVHRLLLSCIQLFRLVHCTPVSS